MFHTVPRGASRVEARGTVVIPWRGFRCFTQTRNDPEPELEDVFVFVVIPWRGFRCFTHWVRAVGRYERAAKL